MTHAEEIKQTGPWRIDERQFLVTPAGTKVGRFVGHVLMFFDKKTKQEIPFTLLDWIILRALHR